MFLPFEFVKNTLATKSESKHKVGILETEDEEIMEISVDILTASDVMCFIRLISKMNYGRVKGTIYRIYIAESAYQRAKQALRETLVDVEDIKWMNG